MEKAKRIAREGRLRAEETRLLDNIKNEEDAEEHLLNEYQKFDIGGIEIEYRPDKDGLKWTCGEKNGEVDVGVLWSIAFLISNQEQRDRMIPVKLEEKRVFYQQKVVKLTKDMKRGSMLTVPFKFTVPLEMLVKARQSGIYAPK